MPSQKTKTAPISPPTLQRLPYYLRYLHTLRERGTKNVSAPTIASALRLHEVQVRKDLEQVSTTGGKPRTGFTVEELIVDIERFLGYDTIDRAILVGAGKLGQALASYHGFDGCGLQIVAAFDTDARIVGSTVGKTPVFSADRMAELCPQLDARIGILTVPAAEARQACDAMIAAGIAGIWNFTPVHLDVPESVAVQNENMALSLALLRRRINRKPEDAAE